MDRATSLLSGHSGLGIAMPDYLSVLEIFRQAGPCTVETTRYSSPLHLALSNGRHVALVSPPATLGTCLHSVRHASRAPSRLKGPPFAGSNIRENSNKSSCKNFAQITWQSTVEEIDRRTKPGLSSLEVLHKDMCDLPVLPVTLRAEESVT